METLTHCPICETQNYRDVLVCKDYTVSKDDFHIQECQNCGFWFTNPRPTEEEIGAYYQSEEYISHSNTSKGLVNRIYQKVRSITVRNKFLLVSSLTAGKSILDYGCGTGEFLHYCKSHSMNTTGFEPDPGARKYAAETNKLNLILEDQLFTDRELKFDVITMWHVLEHVHRLKPTLKSLVSTLKKKGAFLIAVPNHTSTDALKYKEHWAAYDVPRHIYHFGPKDVENLMSEFDMELTEVLPMKYDAFYVSMLSEKYLNGKGNLVKAFFSGLQSNMKASSKSHTWSSQIYIFRRKG